MTVIKIIPHIKNVDSVRVFYMRFFETEDSIDSIKEALEYHKRCKCLEEMDKLFKENKLKTGFYIVKIDKTDKNKQEGITTVLMYCEEKQSGK